LYGLLNNKFWSDPQKLDKKDRKIYNVFSESFMKTIKTEEVYVSEYESYGDIVRNVFHFIEAVYNKNRLHSSIGYLPPNEFEQQFNKKEGLSHISKCLNLQLT